MWYGGPYQLAKPVSTKIGFTQYQYDGKRVTDIQHQDGSSTVLASFSYQYNTAGQLTREVDNGVTTNYVANNMNQYVQVGNDTYNYDADGNLTSITGPGGTFTFTYNQDDLLTGATTPTVISLIGRSYGLPAEVGVTGAVL